MKYEFQSAKMSNEEQRKKCQLKYLLKGDFVMLKDINIFCYELEKK